jgi:hypothetical protein
MPETGRAGKRMYANRAGWKASHASELATYMELASAIAEFSGGITRNARHRGRATTASRTKPRGAGERWHKSFSSYPLMTGCGTASCTSKHPTEVGGSRASSLSLADALCRRPGVASATAAQSCAFANLHPTSPGGRKVFDWLGAHCSEATLLLLLCRDLALGRRLLLRGGLRLCCLLHHIALLAKA